VRGSRTTTTRIGSRGEIVATNQPLSKNEVLVIVPAYNEEQSIVEVLARLLEEGYQVLVVDDGSVDRTGHIAQEVGVNVLTLAFNLGVGGALRAGFKFAVRHDYRAVVQIDADGQHDIHQIQNLINHANESGAHLVLGSRFRQSEESMRVPLFRRLVMRLLSNFASHATGTTITDATSGFRLIQEPLLSEFAKVFPIYYLGDTYEALMSAGRAGFKVEEIPSVIVDRTHGTSSASTLQSIKFIFKSLVIAGLGIHARINRYIEQ
jgi:glycosyltransferase involved in cell wall biosynthesis